MNNQTQLAEIELRMAIANLWFVATGKTLLHLDKHWQDQVADIHTRLEQCSRLPWQGVLELFETRKISWTQAFEMLMSRCGFNMEQALICLAEHFDRRKITIEDVQSNLPSSTT